MESIPAAALPPLLPAVWLAPRLGLEDLVVLDCSWYLPAAGRDPEEEYRRAHIPGAVRFDLDQASAPDGGLPHMLPRPERFSALVERLGIRGSDRVVCYDGSGVNLSAARAWWLFRVFGHQGVAVLDGGFGAWAMQTRPVQVGMTRRAPAGYGVSTVDRRLVRTLAEIEAIVAGDDPAQLVDCRSAERFRGEVDEPRPGLRRGHIPGSRNVPFTAFTDPATGCFRPAAALRAILEEAGLDLARPIVASCGSGVSACALALAVEVIRAAGTGEVGPPVAIYDGSWAEYGKA